MMRGRLVVFLCLCTVVFVCGKGNIQTDSQVRILDPSTDKGIASAVVVPQKVSADIPIPVDQATHIISKADYLATDPYGLRINNIWTPNGKWPEEETNIDRALHVANRTFIIAAVESGFTSLHVYYNTKTETKKVKFGKIDGVAFGNVCTGPSGKVLGVETGLDAVLFQTSGSRKALDASEILTILYTKCIQTVRQVLASNAKKGVDMGPLKELIPSKKKHTLNDVQRGVLTWFNNVNIFFEASSPYRIMMNALSKGKRTSADLELWQQVKLADRYLRMNTGHIFTRVHRGNIEAYFEHIAAVHLDNKDGFSPDNTVYLGFDEASVEVAYSLPPKTEKSDDKLSKDDEEDTSEESAFVEVESMAKGPVSLAYPKMYKDQNVYGKSFLGSGPVAMMLKVIKLAYKRADTNKLEPGTQIEVPCMSKGVLIQRRSVLSPLLTFGEVVCWGNSGYQKFNRQLCKYMSQSHDLLKAIIKSRVSFIGTADRKQCEEMVAEIHKGTDSHLYPISYQRQFNMLTEDDGPLNANARSQIKHVVIGHPLLAHVLKQICAPVANANPYLSSAPDEPEVSNMNITSLELDALKDSYKKGEGITIPQLNTVVNLLFGEEFGQKSLNRMFEDDYMLPLLGVLARDVLRQLKLTPNEKWSGTIAFKEIDWIDGAASFYGDIIREDRDGVLKAYYTAQDYEVSETSTHDPEDEELVDDPREIYDLREKMKKAKKSIVSHV